MGDHSNNRRIFAISLLVIEIIIIIMFGIFVRINVHNDPTHSRDYYAMYQDVNVMMLIGFGFLMTFVKNHSYSALSYTFFINAIIVQLYILFSSFWHRVFNGHWENKIMLQEQNLTGASYSVASVLIAFGAVLGRVGPLELLIMGFVQIIGYSFNEALVYDVLKVYDAGGSMAIHSFGAYFGLAVSFVIGKLVRPTHTPEANVNSNTFAMIGTLFLWLFWPSFNAGFFPITPF
eukprot:GHVR01090484.1.p1 GENE.GHVR01090484.1~~GHVR01090484.1.p1  ORF type:complete len:233 (+),score=5.35 GHVR01090484.1:31-729(+)